MVPDYIKNYRIVFIDENGVEHTKGQIVAYWEEEESAGLKPCGEPILENLAEIDAVMDFIQESLGLWEIKNGKVVAVNKA